MRVTSIELYSDRFEENLKFSLRKQSSFEKYMIRHIVGLDAEELIPRFYGFSKLPSGVDPRDKFYDFTMKPRQVSMRVVLNPNFKNNESYSDVRDELYKMVSATRSGQVIMYFHAEATAVAQLEGLITKFEAGYFNALPEVQITINCENPFFRGVAPVIYDLNDDSYPDPIIIDDYIHVPDSLSTAPHGVKIMGVYNTTENSLRLRDHEDAGEYEWEFIASGFSADADDVIVISSIAGEKNLLLASGPTTTYLLDKITSVSMWPIIFPGANKIWCQEVAAGTLDITRVEYYPLYWGV